MEVARYEFDVIRWSRVSRSGGTWDMTDLDEAIARLEDHRLWVEAAFSFVAAARDPKMIADTERVVQLAEEIFLEDIMDAVDDKGTRQ
jgi:hypothetical protein